MVEIAEHKAAVMTHLFYTVWHKELAPALRSKGGRIAAATTSTASNAASSASLTNASRPGPSNAAPGASLTNASRSGPSNAVRSGPSSAASAAEHSESAAASLVAQIERVLGGCVVSFIEDSERTVDDVRAVEPKLVAVADLFKLWLTVAPTVVDVAVRNEIERRLFSYAARALGGSRITVKDL
jgi:hypothetical protein